MAKVLGNLFGAPLEFHQFGRNFPVTLGNLGFPFELSLKICAPWSFKDLWTGVYPHNFGDNERGVFNTPLFLPRGVKVFPNQLGGKITTLCPSNWGGGFKRGPRKIIFGGGNTTTNPLWGGPHCARRQGDYHPPWRERKTPSPKQGGK